MIDTMGHDEYLELLAGAALDDLDATESARLAAHREGCASCAEATERLDATMVSLALAAPQRQPSAGSRGPDHGRGRGGTAGRGRRLRGGSGRRGTRRARGSVTTRPVTTGAGSWRRDRLAAPAGLRDGRGGPCDRPCGDDPFPGDADLGSPLDGGHAGRRDRGPGEPGACRGAARARGSHRRDRGDGRLSPRFDRVLRHGHGARADAGRRGVPAVVGRRGRCPSARDVHLRRGVAPSSRRSAWISPRPRPR